jgi:hypothetical protein
LRFKRRGLNLIDRLSLFKIVFIIFITDPNILSGLRLYRRRVIGNNWWAVFELSIDLLA